MRADGRSRKAWRRAESDDDDTAKQVFVGLQRRELRDLETCRRVWEQELDPLAVCEAVRQSTLPDWLTSALLVLLTDGVDGLPPLRKKMWTDRTRNQIDAHRAANIAMARAHPDNPQVWRVALEFGEWLSRQGTKGVPTVSAAGAKKSYDRVRQSMNPHPYRYHRAKHGLQARIDEAWAYMLALMKEQVARSTQRAPAK